MSAPLLSGQRQQRATFRQQITLAVVAGVLLMAVLSAVLSAWQGSRQARDTLVSQGLGLAATVAQQTRLALLTQSSENAREAVEHALAFPEVRHIQLLFPDGRSLLTQGQAGQALVSLPSRSASAPYLDAESTEAWVFVAPVFTQVREASPFEPEAARPELIGHVRLTLGKGALQQLVSRLLLVNIGVALACSALLIFLLRRLTVRLTGPLDELAAVMNQAGSAGPAQRARPAGTRELVRMAEAFNRMMDTLAQRETELQHKNEELASHAQTLEQRVAERTLSLSAANAELQQTLDTLREAQKQLVEADKLASLGRLVAGVAHELNTPLGNALIAATALDQEQRGLHRKFEAGELRKSELQIGLLHGSQSAELVHRNVQRAADIIRGFKQLAIDQTTDMRRPFRADEMLGELLSSLAPMFKATPYRIEAKLDPDLQLDSYPGPLGQVLTNIAQNALLHGFEGQASGVFHVDCHAWGDEHVQIVCSDDGVGMSEAVRQRVFEPFFTTKFGQGGSGLGMQIVHTLVKGLLGGRVSVDSAPGLGTRVILTLPARRRKPKESPTMRLLESSARCLLLSPLLLATALASDDELALAYGDAATVSIATGSPQTLRRVPAVATVFTAEDMRAMGATDLEDLLARVPGLHVSRQGGFYSPTWVVRGVFSQYNQQVLLLWNGMPLTTALRGDRGNTGWRNLPVDSLARVEILRGPGSALYGAEAYAGVINLISKSGRELQGQTLGLRAGSFGGRELWLQGGGQRGDWDFAFYAQHSRSDGFDSPIERDAQSSNDAAFGTDVSLAPGPLNLARQLHQLDLELGWQRWRLRATAQQREFRSGAGIAFALDPVALQRTRRLNAELSWTETQLAEHLAAGASLDFQAYHLRYPVPLQIFPPGVRFPTGEFPAGMRGAPETSDTRWRAQAYLVATGWRGHQWRLGAGVERLDLYRVTEGRNFRYAPNGLPIPLPGGYTQEGDLFLYPQTRDHRHVYLQDEWQLAPDWHLTAGLRYDHYDDVGGSTNPRLALVWNARHDLTLKVLHGRAYRAPSFAELYSFSNPVARGNPAIRPETVGTSELVLHWQPDNRLQLQLNLFRFRMEDIIRPTPNNQPGTGTTFNNAGGQLGRGGEAELRWQLLPTLQLQASHAWQRGRDLLTGGRPGYAPEQRSMLGLDWRLQTDWRLGLQLLKVGERARPAGDSRPLLRGYLSADLALRWTPAAQPWSLALQLRNLGNADVREPSLAPGRVVNDLPQAPRSLGLEASWRL